MTATEIATMFARVAHVWEGRGVHPYEPGKAEGCPVCEALDAILGDDREEQERATLHQFWESGLMWLCNLAICHPRGWALTVQTDEEGKAERLFVQGDGLESWVFAYEGREAEENARKLQTYLHHEDDRISAIEHVTRS